MRILHLTNMYPDETRPYWGVFVRNQVETLRSLGVESTVCLVDGQVSKLNYLRSMLSVRALAGSGRFDLVHAHYGLTGLTAAAQRCLPIVLSLYGSDVYIHWHRWVSRIAERRAARTIVCSRRMVDRLRAGREPLVFPPGIDTEHFRARDRHRARSRFGIAPSEKALLFPADPERPVKDYALFEAAVAHLARDDVRVLTLGGVTDDDLPLIYNAADCAVLTSRTEGSPTVIREARASGCPVVSVDVGDVAEQVEGYPLCFITKTRDPEEIARRIADVLAAARPEPTTADLDKISLTTMGRRLIGVYQSILGPFERPRPRSITLRSRTRAESRLCKGDEQAGSDFFAARIARRAKTAGSGHRLDPPMAKMISALDK